MQAIAIKHIDDPRLARYRNLRGDAIREYDGESFVTEGWLCVRRLLESRHQVHSVLVERGKEESIDASLVSDAPLYSLPADQIRELVGFGFHRGALACAKRPPLTELDELSLREGTSKLALAILGVDQHDNLGSMARTAAALGIEHLLIGPRTIDPYARRTIRVSMATILKLRLYDLHDPKNQLAALRERDGVRTVVTTLRKENATELAGFEADSRPCVLVVGNEADGVEPAVQSIATDRVTIPMRLGTDSLNVAVAAAIFLYQISESGQGDVRKNMGRDG